MINHPGLRPPLRRGELVTFPLRAEFPSIGGVARSAGVVREYGIRYLVTFVIARERNDRGNPVNKKGTAGIRPQTYYNWIATVVRQRFQRCSYSFAMTRGLVLAPPPVARGATPPARIPPTQTMFARGPVWGGGIRPPRRLRRHPSAEGNLLRSRCGLSSPPLEGRARRAGWLESMGLGT